jgi:hypothetical protein
LLYDSSYFFLFFFIYREGSAYRKAALKFGEVPDWTLVLMVSKGSATTHSAQPAKPPAMTLDEKLKRE